MHLEREITGILTHVAQIKRCSHKATPILFVGLVVNEMRDKLLWFQVILAKDRKDFSHLFPA